MSGKIYCQKCGKQMTKDVCVACGTSKCYIRLYWNGKIHKFRRYYLDGMILTYGYADRMLNLIRTEIDEHKARSRTFRPGNWKHGAIKERMFIAQAELWIDDKTKEKEAGELAPATLKTYNHYVNYHWAPFFKNSNVREIDAGILNEFKRHLISKGLKGKSRKNIMDALKVFFKWMHREGTVLTPPLFPVIKVNDAVPRSDIAVEAQLRALENIPEKHRAIYQFAMELGLRTGEVCTLKVKDVDIFTGTIIIQRTLSAREIKENTKQNSKDALPLTETSLLIAKAQIKDKLPDTFIFINPNTGRGYKPDTFNRVWNKYSGCEHDFHSAGRHTFCTGIAEAGATLQEAMLLMRHKDSRSTQRYTHLKPNRLVGFMENRKNITPINKIGHK